MVKTIERLPTEKEEMARVGRAVKIAKRVCNGREIYSPEGGTWLAIHNNSHRDVGIYVYPLDRRIEYEWGHKEKAKSLGRALEKKREGEYRVLRR
ncbi:hypothetical protein J4402_03425 [Candidatus Pacearchaeota archaeon]|nr:hypothetical protein [Candidatus Pacearchaeota archaeon]